MHITKISATNLKGLSFSYSLTEANIITGPNASGKSAVLDAIRLLLTGKIKELGEQARAAFIGLASGPEMTITGELSTGETISRRFYYKGNSVKCDESIPESLKDCPSLAVMLDATEYFALGETDRVRFVANLCKMPEEFTVTSIVNRMRDEAPDWKSDLIFLAPDDVQIFIEGLIEEARTQYRTADDQAERMQKTVQGLSYLRTTELPSNVSVPYLERERGEKQNLIAELNTEKGQLIGKFTAIKSARVRRGEIAREINSYAKDETQLAEAKAKMVLIRGDLDKIEGKNLSEVLEEKQKENTILHHRLGAQTGDARRANDARKKAEQDLANLDHQDHCPYCGATGDEWKNIKAAELTQEIDKLIADANTAQEEEQKILPLLRENVQITESIRAVLAEAKKIEAARFETLHRINALQTRVDRAVSLREENERLAPEDPEHEAKVESLQTRINVENARIVEINTKIREAQVRAGDLQRLAQAEQERDKAIKEKEIVAQAGKLLKTIKEEMVVAAFKPLLEHANRFFGGILKTPIAYNSEKNEIGTWRGSVWVSHKTLSGTEKLLVYSAIQAALSQDCPIKLMVIDELGRMTSSITAQVASSIQTALAMGGINQFIGVMPEPDRAFPCGSGASDLTMIVVS